MFYRHHICIMDELQFYLCTTYIHTHLYQKKQKISILEMVQINKHQTNSFTS